MLLFIIHTFGGYAIQDQRQAALQAVLGKDIVERQAHCKHSRGLTLGSIYVSICMLASVLIIWFNTDGLQRQQLKD